MAHPFLVNAILWTTVAALAIPPTAYICWRAFVRAGPDAVAARRWILWFKIALPVFLISAVWSTLQYSVQLGGVYDSEWRTAWLFCDFVGTTAALAMVISLVEAAYWLASVRNNGVPVRNSGWSRILAYIVTAILFCLTITILGLWLDYRYSPNGYYKYGFRIHSDTTAIGLTWQSTMAAISITLVGISIALLVKTRRDAVHLSSAAKLYLIATVLFMFPFVWNIISIGIHFAIISNDYYGPVAINWLGIVSSFIGWGCHVACFYMQLRLRKLKIGIEDLTKQRSASV